MTQTKFLDEDRLNRALEDMFSHSEEYLYLVSPYIKLDDILRKQIKNCGAPTIVLVYGKKLMEHSSYRFLKGFEDIDVYFHKDLHAKLYVNEKEAIVASMNLYDFSMDNNIECGVSIPADQPAHKYALKFVMDLVRDSEKRK